MTDRTYSVAPLRKHSLMTLGVLLALLPLGVLFAIALERIPDDPLRTVQGLVLALLPAAILIPAMMRREVRLADGRLTVKAAFHTRRRAVEELDVRAARVVDLNEEKELRPILRMFGFSLVGFHAGHYRTRGWKKAFALLTGYDRVLAIPEHGGTVLLLSLENPNRLLHDLNEAATVTR